jgi:hypothetical protein
VFSNQPTSHIWRDSLDPRTQTLIATYSSPALLFRTTMTLISEIGLLKLKPEHKVTDEELKRRLEQIGAGLEKFTGHPFYYLQQAEDPSMIYLLGEWNSLSEHYDKLHNSEEFKGRLPIMMQYFDFQWMAHYDFKLSQTQLGAPGFLEVGRFMVASDGEDKEAFQECVDAVWENMSKDMMAAKPLGGWKVDEQRDKEEYVFVLPFKNQQTHDEFYETDAGMAYGALKEMTVGTEVRRLKLLDI